MRRIVIFFALIAVSACSGSSTAPSSMGTLTDISGAWTGTFASSNNLTQQLSVDIKQNGSNISGTWQSTSVAWSGQVSATMNGSSLTGQATFIGIAADNTVCTGTANATGSASATSISLNSSAGVVGGACPAPLPVGIRIELHR